MIWIGLRETESISPIKGDEAVRLAFGNLAAEFRLPLWFNMGLGMSLTETSEVLGLSADHVKKSIETGRGLLLQACEAVGIEADMRSIESLLAQMASEPAPATLMHKLKSLTNSDKGRQQADWHINGKKAGLRRGCRSRHLYSFSTNWRDARRRVRRARIETRTASSSGSVELGSGCSSPRERWYSRSRWQNEA